MVFDIQNMAKLTDNQKDWRNGSFVNFVITKPICKDPWGRLVRYINTIFMHVLFGNYFFH